ncbi:APOBEC1 complementation factor-like protein [Leptotrombidium deliense]|uniref:Probable RNA-binding protein 46 n=1 Tax=Leptotrombidium deliense TaxID=299467 RepID=A0A443SPD1_9ACAR|nr:APOBEC1 complementation factor-like protein [Leptotrombidium deliense]
MYENGAESTSKDKALLELLCRSGYQMVQENGQRKFGPPPDWTGSPPRKGSEVFVGKIPRDCYEDEIVPLFSKIGKIYELRLMMDFSGTNRGYAFIMYTNPQDAKMAVQKLNNYDLRGNKIGVVKSLDNCRLFVGKIPKDKTREDIIEEMRKVTDGVVNAIVHSYRGDRTKNRGYAFVEYENHRGAAMARRKLLPGKIKLWGHDIQVDWADPEPEVDEETMSKVKILYVRNFRSSVTEEDIRIYFSLGGTLQLERVKKIKDYGFVHYSCREEAEMALEELTEQEEREEQCPLSNEGCKLEITWAKPAANQIKVKKRTGGRVRYPDYMNQPLNQYLPSYEFGDFSLSSQSQQYPMSHGLDFNQLRIDSGQAIARPSTLGQTMWSRQQFDQKCREKSSQKSRPMMHSPSMYHMNEQQYPQFPSSYMSAHPFGDPSMYNVSSQFPLHFSK